MMRNIISSLIAHTQQYQNQKGEFSFNINTNYYSDVAKMRLLGGLAQRVGWETENCIYSKELKRALQDFPGGPVAKTPFSQCSEPGFHPQSGNQIPHAAARVCILIKIPHTTTKTQCSQINKINIFKKGLCNTKCWGVCRAPGALIHSWWEYQLCPL